MATAGGVAEDPEITTWLARVSAASGTLAGDSQSIAEDLIAAIKASTFDAKILYLLPLLGSNLAAARVPLRDTLNAGIASNNNFLDADFSQSTGLQGNGSTKQLNTLIKPSQLSGGLVGGVGYWEGNVSSSGTDPMLFGVYTASPDLRWGIDLRSDREVFFFGTPATGINGGITAPGNDHIYGQSASSSDRKIYRAGVQVGSNTSADASTVEPTGTFRVLGAASGGTTYYHNGRCKVAYLTDGTLDATQIAAMHTLLTDYLMTPTGR